MVKLVRTNSGNNDFIKLISLLDNELNERYGKEQDQYNQYNTLESIKNVVIAYDNKTSIGCGSFKEFDSDTVEIKRMYLKNDKRGSGAATQILEELEKWAAELGYTKSVLETGKGQPDAIKFYAKCGYKVMENFGQYKGMPLSLCMSKIIL